MMNMKDMLKRQRVNLSRPDACVSHWTREMASKIKATPKNTPPAINLAKVRALMPGHHVWDNWYLMTWANELASVLGFKVIIALARPIDDAESAHARIVYFYSKDGEHYTAGGNLFDEPLFSDCQEWSGSTIIRRDGKIQTFYTVACSYEEDGVFQTRQRFATAIQEVALESTTDADGNETEGLKIMAPEYHELLAEPDGVLYETVSQSIARERLLGTKHSRADGSDQTENNCWRDILYYECPRTGRRFGLFEANTASICPAGGVNRANIGGADYDPDYAPTIDDLKANGCIGILEFKDDDNTYVELMPPILTANLVTDEIERINIIDHDGHVYLFCVGHGNKNTLVTRNEGLSNRDYLLGFRAKSLFSKFEPMNESGVVIQQKSMGAPYAGQEQNQQYMYSWKLVPTGKPGVFDVIAYSNYSTSNGEVVPVKTAAPTLQLAIHGLESELVGIKYDIQPA